MTQITTVMSQAIRERSTGVSCPTPMTAALTPELAIAYVRELSADVRAVVVLDAGGERLAGARALHGPAREVISALGAATEAAIRVPEGVVVAVRSAERALVAVSGPLALLGPTLLDARIALDSAAQGQIATSRSAALQAAAKRAISAASGAN